MTQQFHSEVFTQEKEKCLYANIHRSLTQNLKKKKKKLTTTQISLTGEWINMQFQIQRRDHYSTMKRNNVLIYVDT